jgi:hypothetical protein
MLPQPRIKFNVKLRNEVGFYLPLILPTLLMGNE